MGVKTDLQPEYGERSTRLPPGPWNLSRAEKRAVCNSFYGMKVPEGYSSNIKNLVSLQDSRLLGLKSHDCHTLMQQLLPVAIRSVLEKPARYAITRLCFFFNAICAKTVDVSKLDKLEEDVVVTLCLLEKYFPPSFFDIMVHLVVQSELDEGGNHGVSENLRWLAAGLNMAVPLYRSYLIKDSTSGLVVYELGFTLVDLSKIGHRNDQFVLASQVKQVFFVDDPMHHGWSVVLSAPNREYNDDVIGDDVLGDVTIECKPFTRGMPNVDTFDELVGEFGSQNIRDGCEDIWIE
ncbi:hypothetical protein ACE6H2_023518 [Prunus campanulata]